MSVLSDNTNIQLDRIRDSDLPSSIADALEAEQLERAAAAETKATEKQARDRKIAEEKKRKEETRAKRKADQDEKTREFAHKEMQICQI